METNLLVGFESTVATTCLENSTQHESSRTVPDIEVVQVFNNHTPQEDSKLVFLPNNLENIVTKIGSVSYEQSAMQQIETNC